MARQKKTPHNYAVQFEHEGQRWIETFSAPNLARAELAAETAAAPKGYRVICTLPRRGLED